MTANGASFKLDYRRAGRSIFSLQFFLNRGANIVMNPSRITIALMSGLLLAGCEPQPAEPEYDESLLSALRLAAADADRTEANSRRDIYRHPVETLAFFGVQPQMTVVEIWPGGGWYTEILAPYLAEHGNLYLAHYPTDSQRGYAERLRNESRQRYGDAEHIAITSFGSNELVLAPPASADVVLTFRNLHNWLAEDYMEKAFEAAYAALKPGGVLGVVEHRAAPGTAEQQMKRSGYVTEALTIEMAQQAGFELDASSEVNSNSSDTKNYEKGVWTLPPTLALKDQDRQRYLSIGESDRMTLRFKKPLPQQGQ